MYDALFFCYNALVGSCFQFQRCMYLDENEYRHCPNFETLVMVTF